MVSRLNLPDGFITILEAQTRRGRALYGTRWPEIEKASNSQITLGGLTAFAAQIGGENNVYARQVMAYVRMMPEREKVAIFLVFGEEMTHREAATVMECKESTISWYIHEARKKLQTFEKMGCRYG